MNLYDIGEACNAEYVEHLRLHICQYKTPIAFCYTLLEGKQDAQTATGYVREFATVYFNMWIVVNHKRLYLLLEEW